MLGVVLWRDAEDGKAVFWCEDQGDLAYFETGDDALEDQLPFDAGDMVQFDVRVEQRLRRASNARLVEEQAYSGLPEKLRQNVVSGGTVHSRTVIPFRKLVAPCLPQIGRARRKA